MGSRIDITSDIESFCELLFEASNEDRLQILQLLEEKPLSVTILSKRLRIGTQEMSRHVSRLFRCGLINR